VLHDESLAQQLAEFVLFRRAEIAGLGFCIETDFQPVEESLLRLQADKAMERHPHCRRLIDVAFREFALPFQILANAIDLSDFGLVLKRSLSTRLRPRNQRGAQGKEKQDGAAANHCGVSPNSTIDILDP
jgi:hypothetical protein